MPKGYWVVNLEVTDPEGYKDYQAFVRPFLAANGGKFLVRGGRMEVVEGAMLPRVVVIEFESFEEARRLYHSTEYQEGRALRLGRSSGNVAIVEGLEG
jgi:uncharacterized protein (DUF1330 family)